MGEHDQANAADEGAQDKSEHERYMARALELAARGAGWVNPNPMVERSWSRTVALSARVGTLPMANFMPNAKHSRIVRKTHVAQPSM